PQSSARFPYTTLFRSNVAELCTRQTCARRPAAGTARQAVRTGCSAWVIGTAANVSTAKTSKGNQVARWERRTRRARSRDRASARSEEHTSELQSPDHL